MATRHTVGKHRVWTCLARACRSDTPPPQVHCVMDEKGAPRGGIGAIGQQESSTDGKKVFHERPSVGTSQSFECTFAPTVKRTSCFSINMSHVSAAICMMPGSISMYARRE